MNESVILKNYINHVIESYKSKNRIDNLSISHANYIKYQYDASLEEKKKLKKILKSVLYIKNIYRLDALFLLLNNMDIHFDYDDVVTNGKMKYTNFLLIYTKNTGRVFSCIQIDKNENKKDCIMKCDLKLHTFDRDFILIQELYDQEYNVPQPYELFETFYFTCFTMEKIQYTILDVMKKNILFDQKQIIQLLSDIVPIIKYLHKKNFIYPDFSISNIGINYYDSQTNYFLFDFGATVTMHIPGHVEFTERYGSIHDHLNQLHENIDDYESLGFVLVDMCYGMINAPFDTNDLIESKRQIIKNAQEGKLLPILNVYFTLIYQLKN